MRDPMSSLDGWKVKVSLILFWAVTILTPQIILPLTVSLQEGVWNIDRIYYYIFGFSIPESVIPYWYGGLGLRYATALTIALFLSLVYAVLVTYYCLKLSYLRATIITGLLSQIIPFMIVLYSLTPEAWTSGDYVGPLPFMFIVGLFVIWLVKSNTRLSENK